MARNIYITSVEGHAGKSTVALGLLDTLSHQTERLGVFRPVARTSAERDYVLELLLGHDGVDLDYDDCVGVGYEDVHDDPDAALSLIIERFKAVEAQCDVVVILGSDYTDVGSPTELSYNARIAANLGAPVLLVLGGQSEETGNRSPDDLAQVYGLARQEL
ncbi:MAG TPA: AAA family ATPase, partial [Homoserinimonas sp.]|nr:AAA family ATPase [Homoserinimonas sp.]